MRRLLVAGLLVILCERWISTDRFLKQNGQAIPLEGSRARDRWELIEEANQQPEPWRFGLGLLMRGSIRRAIVEEAGYKLGVEI